MDYKYIEQLLDRYFDCMTTLEEEQILRSFFAQENVPAHLMQYSNLFNFFNETKEDVLGEDFDARMLSVIEKEKKQATRVFSIRRHIAPLFRAAAIVAVIISVGNIVEHSMQNPSTTPDNATAINPYIKSADIPSAIQIKDESRAEAIPQTDSIPSISNEKDGNLQ